jgi:hypothetical protein
MQELKQKELEELSAVLGELGIDSNVSDQPKEPTETALKRKKKKERSKLAGNDIDDSKGDVALKEADEEEKDPESSAAPEVWLCFVFLSFLYSTGVTLWNLCFCAVIIFTEWSAGWCAMYRCLAVLPDSQG